MSVQRVTSIALAVALLSASMAFAADAQEADVGSPAAPALTAEIAIDPH